MKSYDLDTRKIEIPFTPCLSFKHQSLWKDWINKKGELVLKSYDVQGSLNPGAVVRHNAYAGPTKISQPLELVLPLVFAVCGTISLPVSRGLGVLVVPYVDDLEDIATRLLNCSPKSFLDTFIAGAGDAALQFESKCCGSNVAQKMKTLGCDAILFRSMPWSTQQKTRSRCLSVGILDTSVIKFYQTVLSFFMPRFAQKTIEKKGRGKDAVTTITTTNFVVDSTIRPFIADNIAQGKYWFDGFSRLMKSEELRKKISFERGGFSKMVKENLDWKLEGAQSLVLAVQEALRCRYGNVASDVGIAEAAKRKRMEGEYDKWRIAFSGAKTIEQFRFSLSDLFSRAKNVAELKAHWSEITQLVQNDWQLARDLALVGLASYGKKEVDPKINDDNAEDGMTNDTGDDQ